MKHKSNINRTLRIFLCAALAASCFAACAKKAEPADSLWSDAVYTSDTTLGEGNATVYVDVTAGETSVTFTLHTDAATLGEALALNNLVEGENGQYGLYIKSVNGMTADYDVDHTYWSLYEEGSYAMNSADKTLITDGGHYALVREG